MIPFTFIIQDANLTAEQDKGDLWHDEVQGCDKEESCVEASVC